jgi:hypothetical protein
MSAGHVAISPFRNLALANGNLPAIICCFVSLNRVGDASEEGSAAVAAGSTYPCQQSFIAPSSSRLLQCFVALKRSTKCEGSRFRWCGFVRRAATRSHS